MLFFMCAVNELFFLALYVLYFTAGPVIPGIQMGAVAVIVLISAPVMIVKQMLSIIQFKNASKVLVARGT